MKNVILPNPVVLNVWPVRVHKCVRVCMHTCAHTRPRLMPCHSPPLQVLSQWGWGFTRTDLLDLVKEFVIAKELQTPFKDQRPGREWFERFMRDHPELTVRKSEQFPEARAKATSDPAILRGWFALLEKEMVKVDIMISLKISIM